MQLTANDMRYVITEAAQRLLEGVEWSRGYGRGGGLPGKSRTMNMRINQDMTDRGNINGKMNADTRVFGTRDNILHGDGTAHGNTLSLQQNVDNNKIKENFYRQVIDFCDGKIKMEDIDMSRIGITMRNAFLTKIKNNTPLDTLRTDYSNFLSKLRFDASITQMTYDRVNQATTPDKVKRYRTGIIPETNVKFIALFALNDFNFHTAIKHGHVSQNSVTDEIMGYRGNVREPLPATYDDTKRIGDVASNFSMKDVPSQHYKNQYGLGDRNSYTSVNQFIDKSIIYASTALKDENFIPDYIVAPPSSSNFNKYYSINLSRKIGCEYIEDFFKKKLIQVKVNGGQDVEDAMKKAGFTEEQIMIFEDKVKKLAFKEIADEIRTPIANYVGHMQFKPRIKQAAKEWDFLKKKSYDELVDMIIDDIFHSAIVYIEDKPLAKLIATKGLASYDYNKALEHTILNQKTKKPIENLVKQTASLLEKYADILISNGGFKLKNLKPFKITSFDKRERPFLNGVFIVADKNLSQNGELLTRYKNSKFLIFDEDTNSGATLRMAINALQEKTMDPSNKNVMCLVNGYSKKGN